MPIDERLMEASFDNGCNAKSNSELYRYYRDASRHYHDKTFLFAGNVRCITGQRFENVGIGFGNEKEREYLVRVTDVASMRTGEQRNEDWKQIYFKDEFQQIPLGAKFFFDNNVWLSFNTDHSSIIQNAVLHRCTTVLKMKCENGEIYTEPAFWSAYKTIQNKIYQTESSNISNPGNVIVAQLNDFTKSIKVNDRFVFGKGNYAQTWRVTGCCPFVRNNTYDDDSVTLTAFVCERTESKAADNNLEGIANYGEYFNKGNSTQIQNTENLEIKLFTERNERELILNRPVTVNAQLYLCEEHWNSVINENIRLSAKGPYKHYSFNTNGNSATVECLLPSSQPVTIYAECEHEGIKISTKMTLPLVSGF